MPRTSPQGRMLSFFHWLLCVLSVTACKDGGPSPGPLPGEPPFGNLAVTLRLVPVASGLTSPLYLTAPGGDPRLFIVEQNGRVRIVKDGLLLATPFLDIRSKVTFGGEQGLLSVAFHPQYATNGFFYVNYTDTSGDTHVERYTASTNPDVADAASVKLILFVDQPYANHNGGHVLFGPDGMLYIAMGDGGAGGDPQNHGQNRADILGDLLRIDVDTGDPYAIPSSNPFVNTAGTRGEIWGWGLRNPWRIAFDRAAQVLYIADVGQNALEEINAVSATAPGLNYGWRIMEGTRCFNPSLGCNMNGLTQPVHEYNHSGGECSVSGGLVYRGTQIPEIAGHYFYGDYCSGWIRSFRVSAGRAVDLKNWSDLPTVSGLSSFGEDAAGEIYVTSLSGTVYRIARN